MRARVCFASAVTASDAFLDLPYELQALYYYLAFVADNDGFLDGMRRIVRGYGLSMAEVQALVDAGLLMVVDNTYLIADWKRNNKTDNKNYHPGTHADALKLACVVEDNKRYVLKDCEQSADSLPTDVNINTHNIPVGSTTQPDGNMDGGEEDFFGTESPTLVRDNPPTLHMVYDYAEGEEMLPHTIDAIPSWYESNVRRGWVNKQGQPLKAEVVDSETGELLAGWQIYLKRLDRKVAKDLGIIDNKAPSPSTPPLQPQRVIRKREQGKCPKCGTPYAEYVDEGTTRIWYCKDCGRFEVSLE